MSEEKATITITLEESSGISAEMHGKPSDLLDMLNLAYAHILVDTYVSKYDAVKILVDQEKFILENRRRLLAERGEFE